MESGRWKLIAGGIVLEVVLVAGSVALGVYLGQERGSKSTGPDRNSNQQAARSTDAGRATTDGRGDNPPGPGQESAAGKDTPAASYIITAGGLGVALLALAVYFLIISPRRKRRPMLEAFDIIVRKDVADFPRAEELLGRALINGLRAKDIAEARFAQAYVRARLGQYSESSAVAADLIASGNRERATIYLNLWLQSTLKKDDKVSSIYQEHSELLNNLLDTKVIAGIAFLRKARLHWGRKELDGALHYFEQLRNLDVLTEEIPSHIDDHEVVIGIRSLFDKNQEEARRHFQGAVEAAKKQGKPALHGELGLLLCEWRETDTPNIDDALGKALDLMDGDQVAGREIVTAACTHCGKKYDVGRAFSGKKATCTTCKQTFIVEFVPASQATPTGDQEGEESEKRERLLSDEELLLRNVLLWRAVSLIFTWRQLPSKSGLRAGDQAELFKRLSRVEEVDPDMPDPYLLRGLIGYYFAADEAEREAAVETMDKASTNGVNVPEVLNLIDREQRLTRLQEDDLNRFFVLVKNRLADATVPEGLREQLKASMEMFSRFRQMGEVDVVKGEVDSAPSLMDVQTRGVLLRKRVNNIVKPRLAGADEEDRKGIEILMKRLDRTTRTLSQRVERLEETEHSLMEATGEFLFGDDEEVDAEDAGEGRA
jgi:tetratricopeptide (TPR) repeat protein